MINGEQQTVNNEQAYLSVALFTVCCLPFIIIMANTLCKAERLNSKILIEKMFAGGSKSFSFFPLRVVYMPVENQDAQASVLLSVSKKRFKRAVKAE